MKFHEIIKLINTTAHFKGYAKVQASNAFAPHLTVLHLDVTSTVKNILFTPTVQHLDYRVAYPFLKKEGIEKAKVIINVKDSKERERLIKSGLVEPTPCSPAVFKTAVENMPKLSEQYKVKVSTYHFPDLALLLLYKPEGLVAYAEDRTGEEICKARMNVAPVEDFVCGPDDECSPSVIDFLPDWLSNEAEGDLLSGESGIIRMLSDVKSLLNTNVDIGLMVELLLYKEGNPWYDKNQAVLYGAYLFLSEGGEVYPFKVA